MAVCFSPVRGTIVILLSSTMASALIVNRRVLACELLAVCRLFARVCVCPGVHSTLWAVSKTQQTICKTMETLTAGSCVYVYMCSRACVCSL